VPKIPQVRLAGFNETPRELLRFWSACAAYPLVEQVQTSRSRAQALADRAAFILTIVAIVSGVIAPESSTVQRPAASRMS
jgi:hypothetical protein